MPYLFYTTSQVGKPPKESGPCTCGCHYDQMPKPRRAPGRWMCDPCYEAQAEGYGSFLEEMARA